MTRFRRTDQQPYLAGLRLAGRRVVVVGGGAVVQRRLPLLLQAGAEVSIIAPALARGPARLAEQGLLVWEQRDYRTGDLHGAWYALIATDDRLVNAAAAREADAARVFCVRADDAKESSAWTPATAQLDGVTIGVLAGGDPRRAVQVRDRLVALLAQLSRRAA